MPTMYELKKNPLDWAIVSSVNVQRAHNIDEMNTNIPVFFKKNIFMNTSRFQACAR